MMTAATVKAAAATADDAPSSVSAIEAMNLATMAVSSLISIALQSRNGAVSAELTSTGYYKSTCPLADMFYLACSGAK
jgi:hypothetical protein